VVDVSAALDIDDGRFWTFEDLEKLPDHVDWRRYEIVDGALVVSPAATPRHELAVIELAVALRSSMPTGFRVIGAAMIDLHPSYRIPDVTVLADRVFVSHRKQVAPADVLLAVEIESPSSVTEDRITKPAQYAAAGIPHYWRLETDPLRLTAYELADRIYSQLGTWTAGDIARLDRPFPIELDMAGLLPD
jgi:Uma2 family endonuclease